MEKKNNGFLIGQTIIIILLIIVIIIMATGVFGKKENSNNNTENTNVTDSNQESKEIALDDARFYSIYSRLRFWTYRNNRNDGWQSFTDSELLNIIIDELKESDFDKTEEKISDQWGETYVIYTLSNNIIINYLDKYFGNNVKIDGSKLVNPELSYDMGLFMDKNNSGMSIISYENGKYKIKWVGTGHSGGASPKITETKIVSATIDNNEIIVKEKAIYYDVKAAPLSEYPQIYNIYSDVNKTNKIDSKEYSNPSEVSSGVITVDNYLDKASTITYKFAYDKDTNSYYFKSSVIE